MSEGSNNQPLRVVIADDEPLARRHLVQCLERIGGIEICAQCKNGNEALVAYQHWKPDILLLDIQMPGMTGFDLVKRLAVEDVYRVIFVTAYDHYAVRAFDIHALDYLLKPVKASRLEEALSRYKSGKYVSRSRGYRTKMLDSLESLPSQGGKHTITVHDGNQHLILEMKQIEYVESAGNYACIHYNNEVHIIRQTLKSLLKELDDTIFIRIHRSTLINIHQIKSIRPHINGEYVLTLGANKRVKVSRTYKDAIIPFLVK